MPDRRDDILAHVNDPDYRPVKPKVIAKKIGAEGDGAEAVRKTVKRLVKEGLLAFGPSHLVFAVVPKNDPAPSPAAGRVGEGGEADTGADTPPPAPPRRGEGSREKKLNPDHHVVGLFRRMDAGFGFVRPEGTQR